MNPLNFYRKKTSDSNFLSIGLCGLLYYYFAYHLSRTESLKLILIYGGLWILSFSIYIAYKQHLKQLTAIAFLFRFIFILTIPNLSQDFYRFIWDGRVMFAGINPYLYTPFDCLRSELSPINNAQELVTGMGYLSASHFSNYPPVSQFCFLLGAIFFKQTLLDPIFIFRSILLLADGVTLYFGRKLLKALGLPEQRIFWYLLNPLIIIELTGNLHFEGVMISFLIISLYYLKTNRWKSAALWFSLSVATKLIPLMFLPLILKHLKLKKGLLFCAAVVLINCVLFFPFLNKSFFNNYHDTIELWFTNFEFNASIFNIFKTIGYWLTNQNTITIIGPFMAILILFIISIIVIYKPLNTVKKLTIGMLLVLAVYYFLATTVHPWYISTLLILSVFTPYKFPLVWSLTIILSYSAYGTPSFEENPWILMLEYLPVFGVAIYKVYLNKQFFYKQIDYFYEN